MARFRAFLRDRLGLAAESEGGARVDDLLAVHAASVGDVSKYLDALEATRRGHEPRALVEAVTVPETSFFRHVGAMRAFAEVVIPERVRANESSRRLRFLSAGCASGEEPYTLAILAAERVAPAWDVAVHAVDVNESALEKARRARYGAWSLRDTEPAVRRRWFAEEGRELALDRHIRERVTFARKNVIDDDDALWAVGAYDAIFFRNVLMYLAPDLANAAIARATRALAPGGYLFVGHAETLRGRSDALELVHTHDTFYYRRGSAPVEEASWVESVRRASDRIATLAASRDVGEALEGDDDVERAITLVHEERFADALRILDALGSDRIDARLVRAVALVHVGRLDEAERICEAILARDATHASAHHVIALCRERAADLAAAIEHDARAASLDPTFALARLHLGLVARRAGAIDDARRALAEALPLLAEEIERRLLLFGGGFRRDALVSTCRAQLLACGGAP